MNGGLEGGMIVEKLVFAKICLRLPSTRNITIVEQTPQLK